MANRGDVISVDKLWKIFDLEREKAWEGVDSPIGSREWEAADKWEKRHPVTDTFDLRVQDVLRDAATALSTLQAENAQLRADLEYEREHANAYHEECGQWEAENEKLRAELERVKVERDAYQAYFKDLSSKPDCNTCEKRNCDYRPRIGDTVRANCPLYSGPEKED